MLPDENTCGITAYKQTERSGCKADLMLHSHRREDHNHVITPARGEEILQSIVLSYSRDAQESVCVRVFDREKNKQKLANITEWVELVG